MLPIWPEPPDGPVIWELGPEAPLLKAVAIEGAWPPADGLVMPPITPTAWWLFVISKIFCCWAVRLFVVPFDITESFMFLPPRFMLAKRIVPGTKILLFVGWLVPRRPVSTPLDPLVLPTPFGEFITEL